MTSKVMFVHAGGNKKITISKQNKHFTGEQADQWHTVNTITLIGGGQHHEEYVYDSQRFLVEESTDDIAK